VTGRHADDPHANVHAERLDLLPDIRKLIYMVDLRRLRTLREVAARGTIAAAAEALHLTPSAASQQLAALEREIGHPLLEPAGRSVRLTPAATVLLRRADAIFAELEQLDADLAAEADGTAGTLRVGSFASGIIALVAPSAAGLRAERPDLVLQVIDVEAPHALDLLDRHELDVVVSMESGHAPAPGDPRYARVDLLADPMDVALPAGHRLAERDRTTPCPLAALAGEPFVLPPTDWSCEHVVRAGCQAAGFTPRAAHRASDWAAGLALVAAGLGVSMLPRMAELTPPPGVVVVPLDPAPARHVIAITRRGAQDHPAVAAMLTALRTTAAARVGPRLAIAG